MRQYTSSIDCARQVFKREGVACFHRGLSASYLGTVETALHLVLYERFKTLLWRPLDSPRKAHTALEEIAE